MMPGLEVRVDLREVSEVSGDSSWLIFGLHFSTTQPLLNSINSEPFSGIQADYEIGDQGELDSSNDNSNRDLNETFIINEAQSSCEHQYEAEVVVVTVSDQFLHLIVQCGGTWATIRVDPLTSVVFVNGVRIKEVLNIKMGSMGHMVTSLCTVCKVIGDNFTPLLLSFGENSVPSVRAD